MIYSLCKTKKNGCIRSHPQQSEGVNEEKKPEGFLRHWTGADSALVFLFAEFYFNGGALVLAASCIRSMKRFVTTRFV